RGPCLHILHSTQHRSSGTASIQYDPAGFFAAHYSFNSSERERIRILAGRAPRSQFHLHADDPTVGTSVFFDGTSSSDPDGLIVFVPWDTTGFATGNYTISATVFLARDPTPADNSLTDGTVTLLPPPVVTLTPSSGPDGTKVLVKGSGFPRPAERVVIGQVDVMFDDMFIGFQLTSNGSFNFTLNVPLSQPGTHFIRSSMCSMG